jgi:PAS domain S-box-containing protein
LVEIKSSKQKILESDAKYRFLFENLYDAALLMDVETERYLEVNHQAEIILGRSRDEIIGMHYLQTHPPEQVETYKWRFARHVAMGRAADYEGELVRKDGTRVPVNISASTLVVGGRRMILGLFHDITERKHAEEAAKESENRYRDLFNNASNAVIITDLDGKVVEANQAAFDISGYTIKEITKMHISKVISDESYNMLTKAYKILLKNKNSNRNCELEIVRKDGIKVPIESVSRLLVKNGQPEGFHTLFRDITRQKQFKENMHFYIGRIIKAQEEERRRIARDIHDDTAQSIATLSLDIEAVVKANSELPEEVLQSLEGLRLKAGVILEGVRRLCSKLRPDVLDYLGLLPALSWLVSELNKEKKLTACVKVVGKARRLENETEMALFRIAQEALRNVKKHSEASNAEIGIYFSKDKVVMSVCDNGKGFKVPKAGVDFARHGKLGLIGIQEWVNFLNGTLDITSRKGKGTTLTVTLEE